MKLAETDYDNSETGCCARLDSAKWDGREHVWDNKLFLKDHLRSFLHVPLNFGSVISRDHAAIEDAAAFPKQPFWLTEEVSPWGAELYVAVDRDLPTRVIVRLSGKFVSRLFEGPYRDVGKWISQFDADLQKTGRQAQKLYFFYATCPKCAKVFGKNQVVVFAKID